MARIARGAVAFPRDLPADLKSLLVALLQVNPKKRPSVSDALSSDWAARMSKAPIFLPIAGESVQTDVVAGPRRSYGEKQHDSQAYQIHKFLDEPDQDDVPREEVVRIPKSDVKKEQSQPESVPVAPVHVLELEESEGTSDPLSSEDASIVPAHDSFEEDKVCHAGKADAAENVMDQIPRELLYGYPKFPDEGATERRVKVMHVKRAIPKPDVTPDN